MKCLCGYYNMTDEEIEKEDEVFHHDLIKNNGKEEFIRIDLFNNPRKLIYACPKCGTLRYALK